MKVMLIFPNNILNLLLVEDNWANCRTSGLEKCYAIIKIIKREGKCSIHLKMLDLVIYVNHSTKLRRIRSVVGGIPYIANGAQITPSPYYFIVFSCFIIILGQVRLSQGQTCPTGLGKRFSQGPAGLEPPAGARIIKKGRGYLCSKSKTRDSPVY